MRAVIPEGGVPTLRGRICFKRLVESIKNLMGPYQRTRKKVTRAIRYAGLFGVRSVGPVGDFLD